MKLQNTSSERRVWTGLQAADGRTLGLDPGEVADVDVPEDFEDPWLKPTDGRQRRGQGNPRGGRSAGRSGPESVSDDTTETSGGDDSPDETTHEPAEADASGKEA